MQWINKSCGAFKWYREEVVEEEKILLMDGWQMMISGDR